MMENENRDYTVLVISDSESDRATICLALRRRFRFQLAENEAQALKLLGNSGKRISCIVLDVTKASVDSWAFLRRLSSEDDTIQSAPVLAISGNTSDTVQELALCAGAWGFMGKQQGEKVLLAYIQNAVQYWESKLSQEERRLSDVDRVTGIWNKEHFYREVRRTLNADPEVKYCLIRFDLNRFHVFNDMFGVQEGDKLLRFIAEQLEQKHPGGSQYAHIDADHFVLFVRRRVNVKPEEHFHMLEKLIASYPIKYELTIAAGVYEIDDPHMDPGTMCDNALLALRTVKDGHGGRIGWYDSELENKLQRERELVEELRQALSKQEFEVYYQPQFNAETGDMIGAEALVRWNHPQQGLVPPGKFIPVMERNGLITRLDEYVWEQACSQLSQWRDRGIDFKKRELPISLNISLMDVYRTDLVKTLCDITARYDIPRSMLRLEITETAYMDNPAQLLSVVIALREEGFVLVMDDFGSGYSSINTLKDVPMDALKLDIRFLKDNEACPRSSGILSSVIRMARWLKLPIVAEGVETKEEVDYLKNIGCVNMQGYFFSQPIPAARFEPLLRLRKLGTMDRFLEAQSDETSGLWDADARSALVFNGLVGGAAIIEFDGKSAEMVCVNDRFLGIVNATRGEYAPFMHGIEERFSGKYRQVFIDMLRKAAHTKQETCAELHSKPLNTNRYIWTYCRVKLLSHTPTSDIFYLAVEDVTKQKAAADELKKNYLTLQSVQEQLPCGVLVYQLFRGRLLLQSGNAEAWRLLGCERPEPQAMREGSFSTALTEASLQQLKRDNRRLSGGEEKRIEALCETTLPDGSTSRLRTISEHRTLSGGTDAVLRLLLPEKSGLSGK